MTLLEPTLRVVRLQVLQNAHIAFDCSFHGGVNVIRGRNSSGKTTIMDLLAFSLGSENIRWKAEALMCTHTLVEVQLNGSVACLLREIGESQQRPMSIFWGPVDEAREAGFHQWERYPFKRSAHSISFSQALFTALNMPIAQGDGASNITMHQLMRVLYADQPSVHSPIFRIDSFDNPLTRATVGDYLAGAYDDELYGAQLRLRDLETQISKQDSELRSIFHVLGRSGQTPDLQFLNDKVVELQAARDELSKALEKLKEERVVPKAEAAKAKSVADGLRAKLNVALKAETTAKDKLKTLELDISDSVLFVREVESRLRSLDESKETRSYFGNLHFQFCPSCLSELSDARADKQHCHLCTSELGEGRGDVQLLRMKNELSIQLKESRLLLETKTRAAEEIRLELPKLTQSLRRLERDYAAVANTWSSEVEAAIEDHARRIGQADEELRQAFEHQKLASVISELQNRRDELIKERDRLDDRIAQLQDANAQRKFQVSQEVSAAMVRLLRLDLPLTPEFINAERVDFSFVDNTVFVNGSKNFSESSAVVLRHIFHLALLTASTRKPFMRLPRFMMLDGIDDGGMEKARSHRLQQIIAEECATYECDYQIIYATSDINPDFAEENEMLVGRFYTPTARSLDVRDV